jgi:hypothetical protein
MMERLLFKQTYLRRCSPLWGQEFDDFVIFCIQVVEYLLDNQWMFIRHIPVYNPLGSVRCANRLSYRFVDARYNFNRTTALLTRFNVDVKNPFKSLRPGHRLVFCACVFSCPVDNACLVLFRKAGVIVTRYRLFGANTP